MDDFRPGPPIPRRAGNTAKKPSQLFAATPVSVTRPVQNKSTKSVAVGEQRAASGQKTTSSTLVFQTMHDDLQNPRSGQSTRTAVPPDKSLAAPGSGGNLRQSRAALISGVAPNMTNRNALATKGGASSTSSADQLPLPPKISNRQGKITPFKSRRHRRKLVPIFIIISILLVLAGAAAAFFMGIFPFNFLAGSSQDTVNESLSSAAAVLPAKADLTVQYILDQDADRAALKSFWDRHKNGSGLTISDLLSGDPRLLLADHEISEFYFIVLSDDPRPYLVLPKTKSTTSLLSANNNAKVTELQGWYVAHQLGTQAYLAELAKNSLMNVGSNEVFSYQDNTTPLRFILGSGVLQKFRVDTFGAGAANGRLQELSLAGRLTQAGNGLELSGLGVTLSPSSSADVNQQLLAKVPTTASFVKIGADFQSDLGSWQAASGLLSQAALDPVPVQQLLTQFNSPYVLYTDDSLPNKKSLGLVIEIPVALRTTIKESQPIIEQALAALIPLLTDRDTISPLTFNDGVYSDTALHFANLIGSGTALDYAITENHLLVGTSKEAMFALIDTVSGKAPALTGSDAKNELLTAWGAIPSTSNLMIGTINFALLDIILPGSTNSAKYSFGLAIDQRSDSPDEITIQGIANLDSDEISQ